MVCGGIQKGSSSSRTLVSCSLNIYNSLKIGVIQSIYFKHVTKTVRIVLHFVLRFVLHISAVVHRLCRTKFRQIAPSITHFSFARKLSLFEFPDEYKPAEKIVTTIQTAEKQGQTTIFDFRRESKHGQSGEKYGQTVPLKLLLNILMMNQEKILAL